MLRASLFPLRVDRVREADISRWIAACEKAGLIVLYEAGGKPYLKMLDTRWEARSKPKHPIPPGNGCLQLETPVPLDVVVDECVCEVDIPRKRGNGSKRELPTDWTPSANTVKNLSRELGLRVPEDVDRYVAAFHDACRAKGYRYKDFDAAFRNCVRQDWPKYRQSGTLVSKRVAAG